VKVLDDNADEHVEHEEGDEQQERDEVEQSPFVVVHLRLNVNNRYTRIVPSTPLITVENFDVLYTLFFLYLLLTVVHMILVVVLIVT